MTYTDQQRQAAIDTAWDTINLRERIVDLLELVTPRDDFNDAMLAFSMGNHALLNALIDEAKEFLVMKEAERLLAVVPSNVLHEPD